MAVKHIYNNISLKDQPIYTIKKTKAYMKPCNRHNKHFLEQNKFIPELMNLNKASVSIVHGEHYLRSVSILLNSFILGMQCLFTN